jgi:RNA polymerase sigma-70 factor (ECF subfamily)
MNGPVLGGVLCFGRQMYRRLDMPLAGGRAFETDQDLNREFEISLAESSSLAFRVAFSVIHQRQDAEDIAQEAFVKAFRAFHQLRDRERFRAWLVRITWRLAIDRRRRDERRMLRERVGTEVSLTPEGADAMIVRERAEHLWHAIDALPEKLRVVVVLAGIEEHDLRKVAQLLGLPEGTVRSRLFTARQRLKELLHDQETIY